jgi:serine/threonine protein kinase
LRTQGIAFIVLEHCPGGTLRAQLSDSNVTPRQHLSILSCVASALEAAHAKAVIHRDLKPENILIDEHGLPRVVDFGLARLRGAGLSELTGHGDVMGTPIYMSPEQHRAEEPGPNSDVYSFGVMCYEAIMGELPLGRFAEPQLAGEDALCGLIARALSVDRGQRPSMQDFVGVLNERRALNSPADESGRAGSRGAATWASQPWRAIWAGGAALSLPPQWSYLLFIVTVAAAILRFIETRIPHWRLPPWPFLLVAAFGTIASAPLLFLLLGGFSRQAVWWVAILTPLFYLIWLLAEIHAVLPANEKESRAQQKTERVKSGRRAAARASSRRHSRRSRRRDTSQRVERHPGPTTRS